MSEVLYVVTDGYRARVKPVDVQEWPITKMTPKRIYAKDPNCRVARGERQFPRVDDGGAGCDSWIGTYATDRDAAIAAYVNAHRERAQRARVDADHHDALAHAAEALSGKGGA